MNQVIKKALSTVERSRAACVTLRGIRNETWRCEAFEEIFLELLFGVREKVRELTPHNRRKKKKKDLSFLGRRNYIQTRA